MLKKRTFSARLFAKSKKLSYLCKQKPEMIPATTNKNNKNMVDISGAELHIGDKVATHTQQLFRIGVVRGFTKKKVIVGFAFCNTDDISDEIRLSPFNVAIVKNQNCGLRDYFFMHSDS